MRKQEADIANRHNVLALESTTSHKTDAPLVTITYWEWFQPMET